MGTGAVRRDRTHGGPLGSRGETARQPCEASRARGIHAGSRPRPRASATRVDALFAAAHRGDFDALVAVLDPDVVLRSDGGGTTACTVVRSPWWPRTAILFLRSRQLPVCVRHVVVSSPSGEIAGAAALRTHKRRLSGDIASGEPVLAKIAVPDYATTDAVVGDRWRFRATADRDRSPHRLARRSWS